MKILFCFVKRIIFGALLLYIYNYFAISYHLVIPINLFTLSITSLFDVFGLVGLVIFRFLFL